MSQQFYTYVHLRPDGSPFYVGKGLRSRAHNLGKGRRNEQHGRTVRKYGKENIGVALYACKDEKHAFELEIDLIAMFRSWGHDLANATDGGEGVSGHKQSEAQKLRTSVRQKAWISNPANKAAWLEKMIEASQDPEYRKKKSEARKNRWLDDPVLFEKELSIAKSTFKKLRQDPKFMAWYSEIIKSLKWINKAGKHRRVVDTAPYLKDGWVEGRAVSHHKWVTKDGVSKRVPDYERYLEAGWKFGRTTWKVKSATLGTS